MLGGKAIDFVGEYRATRLKLDALVVQNNLCRVPPKAGKVNFNAAKLDDVGPWLGVGN